jgi:phosphate-selective porin OprO/OprP
MRKRLSPSARIGALSAVLAAFAGLALSATARAQTPPAAQPTPSSQAQAQTTSPPVQAGFQDGFFIQSANGDNRLVFGFVAQTDGRFAIGDPLPITNTFTMRKFRPTLTGQVAKYFNFKLMPDLGSGTTVLQDAYVDIRFSQKFRIRSGKDKTPIGYELIQGDGNLFFPERALASSLVANRDTGVQIQGDLAGGKIFYAGGIFNGIPDGTSSSTELDTNSDKDLAGRVVVQPFRSSATPARPMNGFGFQVGGSNGQQTGALPSFKTSVGQNFFSYATGAAASGVRNRVSPAVFYFYKAFGGFAEFMRSAQPVTRNGIETEIANRAWEITGSYFLTGDAGTYGLVRPRNPFDPPNHHWGALQLVARYTILTVDRSVFDADLAAATANREARSFTVGTNWFPNQSVKIYATFEQTEFSGGAERPTEHVILFRTQLGF